MRGMGMAWVIGAGLMAGPAAAEEACRLTDAVYGQADGYALAFAAPGVGAIAGTSQDFTLSGPRLGAPLTGAVIWNNGLSRPNGFLTHDCPPDADEEELAACTLWEGVLYAVSGGGIDLLPEAADAPAPEQILLPDLGRTLRYSALPFPEALDGPPWDVFTLEACRK